MKYKYNGEWYEVTLNAVDTIPVGSIMAFSGDYGDVPSDYLLCDGSFYKPEDYPDLYGVIGTTYGSSEGYFAVPNLQEKFPIGKGSHTGYTQLGGTGGEKTHKLTINEMPSHSHALSYGGPNATGGTWNLQDHEQSAYSGNNYFRDATYMKTTGGDQAHNNMPPYLVINYIIKAQPSIPFEGGEVRNTYMDNDVDVYSTAYINDTYYNRTSMDNILENKQNKEIVLWTNSNPTSSFTGQDVNIDLSSYSYIEILYRCVTSDPFIQSSGKIPVGYGNKTVNHTWINGEGEVLLFRVTRTTTAKVTFETGYSAKLTDATINTHNDCLIPYKIIGHK